mmetsp:Transcript_61246/g.145959  ORF Transcript_61246/g.145959 Transcript_61246/m.145959 type:complete len:732 (-) Transcript_61246:61-2256(-)|eukprot:CAMPEP_0181427120 /NCGR_PEP_ID=MMETSP1110-20121109/16008_1 /TAXON_ID=174948 /ORGANISM="Symbiodinium sp., Strain CCMP421" /LENGTH=731 /DNA_ID=CAMNT_0023550323 /DNA_START=95 /DNA_END=2290 /DNA_ORIENTATION=+
MAAVLKATYRAEVRRCLLDKDDLCFQGLSRRVSELFPELPQYTAKYTDEEGDVCTLCEASFADFLQVSTQTKSASGSMPGNDTKVILKLELQAVGTAAVPPKPTIASAAKAAAASQPDLEIISGAPATAVPTKEEDPKPEVASATPAADVCMDEDMGQEDKEDQAEASGPSTIGQILSPMVLASVAVCHLPQAMAAVGENEPAEIGQAVCDALSHVPPLEDALRDLRELLPSAGLEHVVPALDALLADPTPDTAGQLVLSLVTGLDLLPFEDQHKLLTSFFASRHRELIQLLEEMAPSCMIEGALTHQAVCDGCEAAPLKGPRFKCTSRADFDLCGTCYARKREILGSEAGDDFECILSGMMPVGLGSLLSGMKGKGKGKGCKGKSGKMGGIPGFLQDISQHPLAGLLQQRFAAAADRVGKAADRAGMNTGAGGTCGTENPLAGIAGLLGELAGKGGNRGNQDQANPLAGLAGLFGQNSQNGENPLAGLAGLFGGKGQCGGAAGAGPNPSPSENPWAGLAGLLGGLKGKGKGKWANPNGTSPMQAESRESSGYEQPTASAPAPTEAEPSAPPMDQCKEVDAPTSEVPAAQVPKPAAEPAEDMSGEVKEEPGLRYSFPVQVDDGRSLQITWKSSDAREQVAREFIAKYRLPGDQVGDIVAFMQHAESLGAPSASNAASSWEEAPGVEAPPTYAEQIAQIQDQGFTVDVEELRNLLAAFGGSVEKVVAALLQG